MDQRYLLGLAVLHSVLYDWGGLNQSLFYFINGLRGPVVDMLALAGTQLGGVKSAVWILLMILLLVISHRVLPKNIVPTWFPEERVVSKILLVFTGGCALTAFLVFAAKLGFNMPRPYEILPIGSVNVLARPTEPYSLPSGHAALAMLVTCVFWPFCSKRWRVILSVSALWIGVSRISVGAHFPVDVFAGYVCGGISGWFVRTALMNKAISSEVKI